MHLTSVRLRGFKSFADDTTLAFTPGITAIVGPNGSGKSNIVDALTWVMGTRSPRQLRGAQMADVIFAGSTSRRGMGRASVEITIDNGDGLLPIEFAEVTIGRSLYTNGEGGSTINGAACRQIDVADLLSDSGLGRESHTIVGQGRIDAILAAEPTGRRVFVEEAAGIVKHRRRKDQAQRKIAQLDDHLIRLDDTRAELVRQMKPLKRQAQTAQIKRRLDAQIHDIQVELALRAWDQARKDQDQHARVVAEFEHELAQAQGAVEEAKTTLTETSAALATVQGAYEHYGSISGELRALHERANGLVGRIEERRAGLVHAQDGDGLSLDPAPLEAQADQARQQLHANETALGDAKAALGHAQGEQERLGQTFRALEQAQAERQRERTKAREAHIRWEGDLAKARQRVDQAQGQIEDAQHQVALQERELSALLTDQAVVAGPGEEELLDARDRLGAAQQALREAEEAVQGLRGQEREAAQTVARHLAQAQAHERIAPQAPDGSTALVKAGVGEVIATLMGLIEVDGVYTKAVSAALGAKAEALVVADPKAAQDWLDAKGQVAWLIKADQGAYDTPLPPVPDAHWLPGLIKADRRVLGAIMRLLANVWLVEDVFSAQDHDPDVVFVDHSGLMAGAWGVGRPQTGHIQAVLQAKEAAKAEWARHGEAEHQLAALTQALGEANQAVVVAQEAVNSEREIAARLQSEAKAALAAQAQHDQLVHRVKVALDQAKGRLDRISHQVLVDQAALDTLVGQEPVLVAMDSPDQLAEIAQTRVAFDQAKEEAVKARLHVDQLTQTGARFSKEIQSLNGQIATVKAEAQAQAQRRAQRLDAIDRCDALVTQARALWMQTEQSAQAAKAERDRLNTALQAASLANDQAQQGLQQAQTRVNTIMEARHDAALIYQRAANALAKSQETLTQLAIEDPEGLMTRRANATPIDRGNQVDTEVISTDPALPTLGNREAEEAMLREMLAGLDHKRTRLGPVNPLASREYAAMAQRQIFLDEQIADLRGAQKDLITLVATVEGHIGQLFQTAFEDVANHFAAYFQLLFPGGTGRLVLTDPDDPLTTGIEIEASPPGKRVKHLRLLSGGERTLTALAMLFAIFTARPSPFYVLDEVEAALDDANLERFIRLLTQLRHQGQWIVVTHQRRTMEVADVLHGISMNRDGVSAVLTQKLGEIEGLAGSTQS